MIRDMLHGFEERFPTRVLVWPVRVQGETCAAEVAAAIRGFNAIAPGPVQRPDVLIVARGGGSLEDLLGFKRRSGGRAAAESAIPLISAVGHETDWTLLDYAADARADADQGRRVGGAPIFADLAEDLAKLGLRLSIGLRRLVQGAGAHLKAAARGLPRLEDLLSLPRQRFDAADRLERCSPRCRSAIRALRNSAAGYRPPLRSSVCRASASRPRAGSAARSLPTRGCTPRAMRGWPGACGLPCSRGGFCAAGSGSTHSSAAPRALGGGIALERGRLAAQSQLLTSLSYQSALRRGFAIVRNAAGAMVRSVAQVGARERLELELADGRVPVEALGRGGCGRHRRRAPRRRARGGEADTGGARPGEVGELWPGLVLASRSCPEHLDGAAAISDFRRVPTAAPTREQRRPPAGSSMNRFEKFFGLKGEAKVRYLDGEFQVVAPGDFVRCAVTGEPIMLQDLRYWSVELQEAYVSAEVSLRRALQVRQRR